MIADSMNNILSVSELTQALKKQIETQFPFVAVKGEIINFKEQASGHLYFTLKDEMAQLSGVLFRGNAQALKRLPKNGDQVVARGELSVYAPRGGYQLIVRSLEFAGVGELLAKLHELKNKLQALGWFDPSKKKQLPYLPRRIGVVTSPTGAVIRDILHILERRFSNIHLILNPVKVQGEGAAQEIAQAIDDFNKYRLADVLIVGRGGGSLEDLWPFNEEAVAAAIYRSEIPVISAVGHETDVTIADFVADVRAPTPSAAAEIVIAEKEGHLRFLAQVRERLLHTMRHLAAAGSQRVDDLSDKVAFAQGQLLRQKKDLLAALQRQVALSSPLSQLLQHVQRLRSLSGQIRAAQGQLLRHKRELFGGIKRQIDLINPLGQVQSLKEKVRQLSAHLHSIDPRTLLGQGYAIIFHEKTQSIIFSSKDVQPGEEIEIRMHDGAIKGKIL